MAVDSTREFTSLLQMFQMLVHALLHSFITTANHNMIRLLYWKLVYERLLVSRLL
jgi:hypothetical protein